MNEIKRCPRCGIVLNGDELYCPDCGFKLGQVHETKQVEKSYWKSPKIWSVFVLLVVITSLMVRYLKTHPVQLAKQDDMVDTVLTIKEPTNKYSRATNQNFLGISYVSDDSVYLSIGGELLKYNQDLSKSESILDLTVTGFDEDKTNYYFVDYDANNYVKKDKKTGKEDIILKNVYYVHKLGDKVYYQHDDDNESIHCYDLKDKTDIKINDEVSYNIIVDEKKELIFYTTPNSELFSIKIDSSDKKKIADKIKTYTYDGKTLFYLNDKGLVADDLSGKTTTIYENSNLLLVNFIDETLIVHDGNTIYTMNKSGEKVKKLYTMDIGGDVTFEVVGDKLLVLTKGGTKNNIGYEIVALDGKRHLLDNQEKPTLDGDEF